MTLSDRWKEAGLRRAVPGLRRRLPLGHHGQPTPAKAMSYSLHPVLRHLRMLCDAEARLELNDAELLDRFSAHKEESAFTLLVQRHGPMVLAVCQRLLHHQHAAEDAFQATFLILVRRGRSFRKGGSLGSWLYGIARRVALRARSRNAAQRTRENRAAVRPQPETLDALEWQELRSVLDEEIGSLPDRYRVPMVLCYLEGKRYDHAARELGWPKSSLASRLTQVAINVLYREGEAARLHRLLHDWKQSGVTDALGAFTIHELIPELAFHLSFQRSEQRFEGRVEPVEQTIRIKPGECRDLGAIDMKQVLKRKEE